MAPNHKLTSIIKGRKVVGISNEDGKTIVSFDDGSTLRIKTGASSTGNAASTTAASTSGDAVANTAANQNQQDLMPPQTKRSDVFRNLQWNETAFNEDVSRQVTAENTPHSEVSAGTVSAGAAQPIETADTGATKAAANQTSTGGTVKSVMQGDTTITLQFEDGSKMDIPLAEASSSVMLRGKDNLMEYAD